jgi:trans-aconitate 2-methyltransferase
VTARDWDASTYDRVSGPQVEWAERVLERLPLRGDESVLDAGCGSGRVTRMLLDRLPDGRVVAVDSAPSMVEHAREALGDRATVFQANLTELELDEPVDAVFSNAVFHWVPDHRRLFERMFAALRPGGVIVAQCGGAGNVERFHEVTRDVAAGEPFAEHFEGWTGPWHFSSAEEAAELLDAAGFDPVSTWLEPSPVTLEEPAAFLRSVCLGPHLERLPDGLREPYLNAVVQHFEEDPTLDYVRLNIDARRPE